VNEASYESGYVQRRAEGILRLQCGSDSRHRAPTVQPNTAAEQSDAQHYSSGNEPSQIATITTCIRVRAGPTADQSDEAGPYVACISEKFILRLQSVHSWR
jgi:hypothetical protein